MHVDSLRFPVGPIAPPRTRPPAVHVTPIAIGGPAGATPRAARASRRRVARVAA